MIHVCATDESEPAEPVARGEIGAGIDSLLHAGVLKSMGPSVRYSSARQQIVTHGDHRAPGGPRGGRVSRKSASQHCGATSCTGAIDYPSVPLRFTQPR